MTATPDPIVRRKLSDEVFDRLKALIASQTFWTVFNEELDTPEEMAEKLLADVLGLLVAKKDIAHETPSSRMSMMVRTESRLPCTNSFCRPISMRTT